MEPPIRCKFFDDDGNPVPPGCRFRSGCRFVHPTDPVWSSIMPYRPPPHSRRLSDDRAAPTRRTSLTGPDIKESASWGDQDGWGSWTDNDTGWGQAWGQGSSQAHQPNDSGSGWGQGWGQGSSQAHQPNDSGSGWGQGWGHSSSSRAQTSNNPPSDNDSNRGQARAQSTTKAQSPPASVNRALTNSPSVLHATPAMSRLRPPEAERKVSKIDISQTTAPKEVIRPALHAKLQQRSLDYKPSSPIVPASLSSLLPRRGDEISSPLISTASQTPKALHANLINELVAVVLVRYKLLKVEEKKIKWRGARQSSSYHHSSPAAREILNRNSQDIADTIGILTKQLNSSLKKVIQYSDALDTHKQKLTKGLNSQNIMSYTSELRDWVVNVNLQRRLGDTKTFIKQREEENAAIKQRRGKEMDGLSKAMEELELKATDIWDELCRLDTDLPERFNEEFTLAKNAMKKDDTDLSLGLEMLANMGIGGEDIQMIRNKSEIMDQAINNFTTRSQELQARVKRLESEVAELRQKDSEINEFREEARARLTQMHAWNLEDTQKMDQMSRIIESLNMATARRPAPLPPTYPDDLVPRIKELVSQYIAEEVKPALDAIAEACEEGNQHARAELDKLLEQVVLKTYDLVQMNLRAKGLFPQIVPQSQ